MSLCSHTQPHPCTNHTTPPNVTHSHPLAVSPSTSITVSTPAPPFILHPSPFILATPYTPLPVTLQAHPVYHTGHLQPHPLHQYSPPSPTPTPTLTPSLQHAYEAPCRFELDYKLLSAKSQFTSIIMDATSVTCCIKR